jgi:DNA-binding NarL/FixJ family response regulator
LNSQSRKVINRLGSLLDTPYRRQINYSPRQQQVVGFLVKGLSNKEIATELGTSEQVIKNQVRVIYLKAGVEDRVHFVLGYYREAIEDYEGRKKSD